jgi:hypothetical protein
MRGEFAPGFKLLQQLLMVAAIEAPFTLFQKTVEMVRRDAIESTSMPLRLVPEVLTKL